MLSSISSDLVELAEQSLDISSVKKEIETGPDMLYMVGKIFLYGICFNMVYNESGHKYMNNLESRFFREFRKKYQSF